MDPDDARRSEWLEALRLNRPPRQRLLICSTRDKVTDAAFLEL